MRRHDAAINRRLRGLMPAYAVECSCGWYSPVVNTLSEAASRRRAHNNTPVVVPDPDREKAS